MTRTRAWSADRYFNATEETSIKREFIKHNQILLNIKYCIV